MTPAFPCFAPTLTGNTPVVDDDPIPSQIEGLGYRRLAVWVGRFALYVLAAGIVLGLVVKHGRDAPTRASVALLLTGLLLGFATSILAPESRRLARSALVALGLTMSLVGFVLRTLFGWSMELPLLMTICPLMLPLGYVIGQIRPRS